MRHLLTYKRKSSKYPTFVLYIARQSPDSYRDKWTQDLTVAHQQRDAPEHSKALLYIGRWMEDTAYFETQTILKQYKVCTCRIQFCTILVPGCSCLVCCECSSGI